MKRREQREKTKKKLATSKTNLQNKQENKNMKIFERDGKINFVDDNNVFVGYDYSQDCCEVFGWTLTKKFPTGLDMEESGIKDGINPDGFQFDRKYLRTANDIEGLDEGNAVVFRLVKGTDEVFLMLFNSHNGYYSHGFEMTAGSWQVYQGRL